MITHPTFIPYIFFYHAFLLFSFFFFFNDTATTEIYTLSLHDALPISLAEVTTVALYSQQLVDPIDGLMRWMDELQLGGAALSRLLGAGDVADDRSVSGRRPRGEDLSVDDVRYAYRTGRDVLHGISLDLRPGERLAVVGPSGAGKSTLGRLLAGIHPPRAGRITVDDVDLVGLPLEELRREVALV